MSEKTHLYLQKGAKEVWIYEQTGTINIYNAHGKMQYSAFFDNLPKKFDY